MTSISKRWDVGLGRWRDPYPHELPAALRGDDRSVRGGLRRMARDARTRARRQGQQR